LTSYIYTGVGDERPLDPDSTYFWRVTAGAPSMFPGEFEPVVSPIYRFKYEIPSGEGALSGGGLGELPGQSGEEAPPPGVENPIFGLLRNYLSPAMFAQLVELFGSFEGWSIDPDRCAKVEGREYSLLELTQYFQTKEIVVVFVAVSQ